MTQKNDDNKVRSKLLNIADRLYRFHELQARGIEAIPEQYKEGTKVISLRHEVKTLIDEFQKHGLFLVPVGELESWLPVLMNGLSREDKSQWAMFAAEKIEERGEREDDIWQFIRTIHNFLQQQLSR